MVIDVDFRLRHSIGIAPIIPTEYRESLLSITAFGINLYTVVF